VRKKISEKMYKLGKTNEQDTEPTYSRLVL